MNKSAIQKFAIQARRDLIEQVKQRAYQYGIDETGFGDINAVAVSGRVLSSAEKLQRQELIRQIQQKGYAQEMEEVAYTWFNRFIALRFMEVNNYLPSHIRVFSDASGSFSPEILKDALHLDLPGLDKGRVAEYIESNSTDDLYRYLLLTQCNALNSALPEMFEKLGGYSEMLLPNNILKPEGVIGRLVSDIPEEDFRDAVQIIGWMYQYYNTEPKQAVFDGLKKNVKITKEKIPAATQLFTPDWIVRYMVENSLGRLWLESHPNDALKANWKYYLDEAEQTQEVAERLRVLRSQSPVKSPEDIRLIDPCMGSGHILVYAFDVLMQIYESEGYNPRDAAKLILEKNIYGLDIDRRAYQLAYFSLMMKARQYNRRIFTEGVKPQVYHPAGFPEGEEYGSLVKVDTLPPKPEEPKEITLFTEKYETTLNAWNFKRLLVQKYDVVVTNPPYMGGSGMGAKMSDFVKKNYPDSKSDLFAVFIEKCGELLKPTGYQAMITQHAWMFLSSYEKLRGKLMHRDIINMAHLGARAFEEIGGEVVQTTSFVLSKRNTSNFEATYVRLVDYNSQQAKEEAFLSGSDRHTAKKENFEKIPGSPVAYWVSEAMLRAFDNGQIYAVSTTPSQNVTGNNARFVRKHWELPSRSIGSKDSWIFYAKGGGYRKWYGNLDDVVNWTPEVRKIYQYGDGKHASQIINKDYWYRKGITWGLITSNIPSFRVMPDGATFDKGGSTIIVNDEVYNFVFGLLNSKAFLSIVLTFNPTLNFQIRDICNTPLVVDHKEQVDPLVTDNITLSRADWDSFETSWDFKVHPLVQLSMAGAFAWGDNKPTKRLSSAYKAWELLCEGRFNQLKANEEELNRIFIEIYGLQDELTPEVEDKDVTVRKADLSRDIKSLISYAVGCMFGRYSLDVDGLAYAGGEWDDSKYSTFTPDRDNIIPICDDEYFDDDITGRFVKWVETVYGSESLEENLKFIADALGSKGSPREVIRSYFLNDFYADHLKVYQNRPIYWLFDSGKKNGFKALIYMHRYQRDLLARMRTDYVHEQQERYRTQLTQIGDALTHVSGSEAVKLSKQQMKIQEQSLEIQKYEEKIHHLADQNIEIDLDDGVKHNYALFEDVLAKIK